MSAEIGPSVVASAESAMSEVVASQVSVRDLKTHLSEWLGRVQAGEVVEVTSRRKPIARITAVKPADSGITSPLQKAMDAGLISWNGHLALIKWRRAACMLKPLRSVGSPGQRSWRAWPVGRGTIRSAGMTLNRPVSV